MKLIGRSLRARAFVPTALLLLLMIAPMAQSVCIQAASRPKAAATNSWRGITPLQSTVDDVARVLGVEPDSPNAAVSGPFAVEDGEVTFSYLTPGLAKIYRAPRSMVGKVFTIHFRPNTTMYRAEMKLSARFKRCTEDASRAIYYLVNDAGVAYQFASGSDALETIIYQPSRAEVRRLSVNTECVF